MPDEEAGAAAEDDDADTSSFPVGAAFCCFRIRVSESREGRREFVSARSRKGKRSEGKGSKGGRGAWRPDDDAAAKKALKFFPRQHPSNDLVASPPWPSNRGQLCTYRRGRYRQARSQGRAGAERHAEGAAARRETRRRRLCHLRSGGSRRCSRHHHLQAKRGESFALLSLSLRLCATLLRASVDAPWRASRMKGKGEREAAPPKEKHREKRENRGKNEVDGGEKSKKKHALTFRCPKMSARFRFAALAGRLAASLTAPSTASSSASCCSSSAFAASAASTYGPLLLNHGLGAAAGARSFANPGIRVPVNRNQVSDLI